MAGDSRDLYRESRRIVIDSAMDAIGGFLMAGREDRDGCLDSISSALLE